MKKLILFTLTLLAITLAPLAKAQCPGTYSTSYKITNVVTGTLWFTTPPGTTSVTVTDASTFFPPNSIVCQTLRRNDGVSFCNLSTVTFPIGANQQFKIVLYNKTSPPGTNGVAQVSITYQ